MKNQTLIQNSIIALLVTLAGMSVTGQTVYTWTGAANGTNLSTAANWTTNGVDAATTLPNGNNGLGDGFQDSAQWDGRTSTNLLLIYNTTWPATGFGSVGVNLVMTASQTNDLQITTTQATSAGVGVNHVTNNSPNAAFTMGDDTANNWLVFGRPAGAIHYYVNNSTVPATIKPSVKFQAGGGAGYTYQFGGTGNWNVYSFLMPDNNAFSASPITVDGPGTVFWYGGKAGGYNPNSALGQVTLNGGMLVIKNAGLFTGAANQAIVNGAALVYDATGAQALSGVISGAGTLTVANGTLTLSGQSIYTGTTLLNGGTLIVNGAETELVSGPLGLGGTISFGGGTLQFSVNNVYDYSGRFSAAAGQAYSLDTGGQNVIFTNATGLGSVGGTLAKLGNGTLTLAGPSTYSGATTISGGKLVFQGTKTGVGNITVGDSAALGVTATGTLVTPGTLTVGTSGSATLEFNNVNSTITAPLAAGTVSAAGPITININSGTFAPGSSYPLFSWTSGSAPAVSLGVLNGFIGNLSTNGNSIQLNITATAYKWTGINNDSWDLSTGNNWEQNGGPVIFVNGGPVLFDDTSSRTNIIVNALVQPTTVTVNPETNAYTLTSSGGSNLGGSASLTKSGNGSLTLAGGANTYTGVTTISDGILSVGALANGGAASDLGSSSSSAANLVLNGGVLQYTGSGATLDRLFTLSTSGGTIEDSGSGALIFNNPGALGYLGNGPRTLTLTGGDADDNTLAAVLANNGGGTALIKNGAGKWVLTGTNTYSGGTTVNAGELQVGAGGGSGTLGSGGVVNNGLLTFNRTGTLTVSGAVSGSGSVSNFGSGTVILANNNTYGGGTTIAAGTLQIGNGGGTGALNANGAIANEGTLIFNSTAQPPDIFGIISGTGSLIKRGSGTVRLFGANTFTGNTTIEAGTLQICTGNVGAFASPQITISSGATLLMVRQDNAAFIYAGNIVGAGRVWKDINNVQAGDVTLTGTNTYTGNTFIAGGGIILGDLVTAGAGSIVGNVIFTNSTIDNNVARSLTFNRPDDYTFSGNILGANTGAAGSRGSVTHGGSGVLTLTGNNTYVEGTTITVGTLQVGNGGTSGTIGTGNATVNGPLVFNRSDSLTYGGNLSGGAPVVQYGPGTTILTSTDYTNYFGTLTVSNGTLSISGYTAPNTTNTVIGGIDVNGGALAVGGIGSVSALDVQGALNVNGGTLVASLNTALTPSNTVYAALGGITVNGGTLKLINTGPPLVVGRKFTLFRQAVSGLTIVSPGFTVQNDLATDGSVTVTALQPPPTITTSVAGNQLNLMWPAVWAGGVHLQGQTNSLKIGLSNNWVTIPGTDAGNTYSVAINPTNAAVFYRLIAP